MVFTMSAEPPTIGQVDNPFGPNLSSHTRKVESFPAPLADMTCLEAGEDYQDQFDAVISIAHKP